MIGICLAALFLQEPDPPPDKAAPAAERDWYGFSYLAGGYRYQRFRSDGGDPDEVLEVGIHAAYGARFRKHYRVELAYASGLQTLHEGGERLAILGTSRWGISADVAMPVRDDEKWLWIRAGYAQAQGDGEELKIVQGLGGDTPVEVDFELEERTFHLSAGPRWKDEDGSIVTMAVSAQWTRFDYSVEIPGASGSKKLKPAFPWGGFIQFEAPPESEILYRLEAAYRNGVQVEVGVGFRF